MGDYTAFPERMAHAVGSLNAGTRLGLAVIPSLGNFIEGVVLSWADKKFTSGYFPRVSV